MNRLQSSRFPWWPLVLLLWVFPLSVRAVPLYDDGLGNTPGNQAWLFAGGLGGAISETALPGTGVRLMTDNGASAGYSSHIPLFNVHKNAAFPVLDRDQGFRLTFELQVNSETHASPDRSGFSLILLDKDSLGIELSFWEDEVWAKNADAGFSHGEGVAFATGGGEVLYQLDVDGSGYRLSASGMPTLNGLLRDYSFFGVPYSLGNYVFLGDDTSSAAADVTLGRITLDTHPVPEPGALLLLSVGLLAMPLVRGKGRTFNPPSAARRE